MEIGALLRRNLLRFFRDKLTVFFSLLSVLIMVFLYAAFLTNVQTDSLVGSVKEQSGMTLDRNAALNFVNSWLMAGIMVTAIVNSVLTATQNYIRDVERGISRDILLTPTSRFTLVVSYILSNIVISFILSSIVFSAAFSIILAFGASFIGIWNLLGAIAAMNLCIFAFSALICYLTSFLKTTASLSALCTIAGVFIGFFAGIYVPMGAFPKGLQYFLNILPFTHATALFRYFLMDSVTAGVFLSPQAASEISGYFGLDVNMFGYNAPIWLSAIYIALTGIVFTLLSVTRMSKKIG